MLKNICAKMDSGSTCHDYKSITQNNIKIHHSVNLGQVVTSVVREGTSKQNTSEMKCGSKTVRDIQCTVNGGDNVENTRTTNDAKEAVETEEDVTDDNDSSNLMLGLLDEFSKIYKDKLERLESSALKMEHQNYMQEKVRLLESWLSELGEQNAVLVGTVAELERESGARVTLLQGALGDMAPTTRDACGAFRDHQLQVREVVEGRLAAEDEVERLRDHLKRVQESCRHHSTENANLHTDIESLLDVLTRARATGVWRCDDVSFLCITAEQVFGPVLPQSGASTPSLRSCLFHSSPPSSLPPYSDLLPHRGSETASSLASAGQGYGGCMEGAGEALWLCDGGCAEGGAAALRELRLLREARDMANSLLVLRDKRIADLQCQLADLQQQQQEQQQEQQTSLRPNGSTCLNDSGRLALGWRSSAAVGEKTDSMHSSVTEGEPLPADMQVEQQLAANIDVLACRLAEAEEESEVAREQVRALRRDVVRLQGLLEEAGDARAAHQTVIQNLERRLAESESEAKELKQRLFMLERPTQHLSKLQHDPQRQFDRADPSARTSDPCTQEVACMTVSASLAPADQQLDWQSRLQLSRLENEVSEKGILIRELQGHLATARHECHLKDETLDKVECKLQALRAELVEHEERREYLEQQLVALQRQLALGHAHKQELAVQMTSKGDLLRKLERENWSLAGQLNAKTAGADSLQLTADHVAGELISRDREVMEQRLTIASLQEALVATKQTCDVLRARLDEDVSRAARPPASHVSRARTSQSVVLASARPQSDATPVQCPQSELVTATCDVTTACDDVTAAQNRVCYLTSARLLSSERLNTNNLALPEETAVNDAQSCTSLRVVSLPHPSNAPSVPPVCAELRAPPRVETFSATPTRALRDSVSTSSASIPLTLIPDTLDSNSFMTCNSNLNLKVPMGNDTSSNAILLPSAFTNTTSQVPVLSNGSSCHDNTHVSSLSVSAISGTLDSVSSSKSAKFDPLTIQTTIKASSEKTLNRVASCRSTLRTHPCTTSVPINAVISSAHFPASNPSFINTHISSASHGSRSHSVSHSNSRVGRPPSLPEDLTQSVSQGGSRALTNSSSHFNVGSPPPALPPDDTATVAALDDALQDAPSAQAQTGAAIRTTSVACTYTNGFVACTNPSTVASYTETSTSVPGTSATTSVNCKKASSKSVTFTNTSASDSHTNSILGPSSPATTFVLNIVALNECRVPDTDCNLNQCSKSSIVDCFVTSSSVLSNNTDLSYCNNNKNIDICLPKSSPDGLVSIKPNLSGQEALLNATYSNGFSPSTSYYPNLSDVQSESINIGPSVGANSLSYSLDATECSSIINNNAFPLRVASLDYPSITPVFAGDNSVSSSNGSYPETPLISSRGTMTTKEGRTPIIKASIMNGSNVRRTSLTNSTGSTLMPSTVSVKNFVNLTRRHSEVNASTINEYSCNNLSKNAKSSCPKLKFSNPGPSCNSLPPICGDPFPPGTTISTNGPLSSIILEERLPSCLNRSELASTYPMLSSAAKKPVGYVIPGRKVNPRQGQIFDI